MKIVPHWLKLDVNIFSNKKIIRLRKMPEGDSIFCLWVYMICEGMKNVTNPGSLEIAPGIPMTDNDFADALNVKLDTIQMAIKAFNELGMIFPDENGCINVKSFRENQSVDRIEHKREQARIRKQKQRDRDNQLLISYNDVTRDGVTSHAQSRVEERRVEKSRIEYNNVLFNSFWEEYAYKKQKPKAYKAFNRLSKIDQEAAIKGIDEYDNKRESWKAKQMPASYLNARTWEDEYTEQPKEFNYIEAAKQRRKQRIQNER